jgi:hypothetical protein
MLYHSCAQVRIFHTHASLYPNDLAFLAATTDEPGRGKRPRMRAHLELAVRQACTSSAHVVWMSVLAPELERPFALRARLPTVSTKEQIMPP